MIYIIYIHTYIYIEREGGGREGKNNKTNVVKC